ncbi:DUF1350 family protein [Prochlorococcus marinus]|uniref:Alpha/beta hydrolase n=1 Tax=Prochlorococcus marinus XMU1408 TaxID=2213228 RepID=A0A318R5G5_PROMR|nr:DUF1350 family protein [Prochlorococcus marinus]MBW3041648.1 alpha/beta hydrolase [Prochlorococcus marinus str. XMU1408]PYE02801.1 alpha/beta hydrolase [Prochlorococcus marinus XMU1408]
MGTIRRISDVLCQWPSKPIGLIEIIGGSYISIKPEVSYKRLITGLLQRNFAVHSWSYIPNFDHQIQANQAWKQFRISRKILEERVGLIPKSIRLGHSLGCKLHLLAPDGGRNCNGLVAISFNNFRAKKSIPMLNKISQRLNFQTEFSPSPFETLNLIKEHYEQINNLLIRFKNDSLDQNNSLIKSLRERDFDNSKIIQLDGNHLSPVSLGLREKLLKTNLQGAIKYKTIDSLVDQITHWDI